MLIRPATRDDLGAIAAIHIGSWRAAYRGLLSDDYLGEPVARDLEAKWLPMEVPETDILLVAEDAGTVTGFIYIKGSKSPAYIDNLHVDAALKRSGIGAQLMVAGAQALVGRNHTSAYLTVITDNEPAVNFYRKMGGDFGPEQTELLYGEPVQTYPVHWPDLSTLAG